MNHTKPLGAAQGNTSMFHDEAWRSGRQFTGGDYLIFHFNWGGSRESTTAEREVKQALLNYYQGD